MKKLLLILIFFSSQSSYTQIQLGQPTRETVYFLDFFLKERPNLDVEKSYHNGELQEVIIEKYDQLYYDLDAVVDVVEKFVFEDGHYRYHLEQFPELSVDYVEEKFFEHYADHKSGSYYISEDFSEYRKVSLINGLATVTTGIIDAEIFSEEELKEFKRLDLKYQQELDDHRKKKESLWNDYVNLDNYYENFVKRSLPPFTSAMVDLIEANFDHKDSFRDLSGKFRFRVYAEQDSKFTGCEVEVIQSNIDYKPQKLYNLPVKLPIIIEKFDGRDYYRNREVFFDLNFDLTRGEVMIKKRKNRVEFIDGESLTAEKKTFLEENFDVLERGKYRVHFQFGHINETSADFAVFKKI